MVPCQMPVFPRISSVGHDASLLYIYRGHTRRKSVKHTLHYPIPRLAWMQAMSRPSDDASRETVNDPECPFCVLQYTGPL